MHSVEKSEEPPVRKYRVEHTRPPGKSFLLGLISTIFPCFYDPKIQVFGVWPWPGPSFPLFQLFLLSSSYSISYSYSYSFSLEVSSSQSTSFCGSQFSFNCCLGFPLPAVGFSAAHCQLALPVLTSICSVHSMPTGAVWTFNCLLFECATAGHGK